MNESLSSAHLSSVDWLGHLSFALNSSEERQLVGCERKKERAEALTRLRRGSERSLAAYPLSQSLSYLLCLRRSSLRLSCEAELSSSERQSFSYLYHAEQSINLSRVEFRPYRAAEHSSLPSEAASLPELRLSLRLRRSSLLYHLRRSSSIFLLGRAI